MEIFKVVDEFSKKVTKNRVMLHQDKITMAIINDPFYKLAIKLQKQYSKTSKRKIKRLASPQEIRTDILRVAQRNKLK